MKNSGQATAVHFATALLFKQRKDDAEREKEREQQATADAEKARKAVPMAQCRPQSINAVLLRATWQKMISQPLAAREAARLAKKAPAKKSTPAKVQAVASSKISPAIRAELVKMQLSPRTVEGRSLSQKIETAKRIISVREKMKKDKKA